LIAKTFGVRDDAWRAKVKEQTTELQRIAEQATGDAIGDVRKRGRLLPGSSVTFTVNSQPTVQNVLTALAPRTIQGLTASGTRTVSTLPLGSVGNDRPIEITEERWISDELAVVIESRTHDPRTGTVEFRLTNIQRAEPPRELFMVPADYQIIDAPPPPPPPPPAKPLDPDGPPPPPPAPPAPAAVKPSAVPKPAPAPVAPGPTVRPKPPLAPPAPAKAPSTAAPAPVPPVAVPAPRLSAPMPVPAPVPKLAAPAAAPVPPVPPAPAVVHSVPIPNPVPAAPRVAPGPVVRPRPVPLPPPPAPAVVPADPAAPPLPPPPPPAQPQ
jgi:hypothetical protein